MKTESSFNFTTKADKNLKFRQKWERIRQKGKTKFVLMPTLGWVAGGWFAITVRSMYLANFELSQINLNNLFSESGEWFLFSFLIILGALYKWEKNEKKYLNTIS